MHGLLTPPRDATVGRAGELTDASAPGIGHKGLAMARDLTSEPARPSEAEIGRAAAAGALAATIGVSLLDLIWIAGSPELASGTLPAAIAILVTVPLQIRILIVVMRGTPGRAERAVVSVLAVTHAAALVLVGVGWVFELAHLLVAANLVLPGRRTLFASAAVVVLSSLLWTSPLLVTPSLSVVAILWRSITIFVLVRLVVTVRRLQATNQSLRDRAVVRERIRIGGDLRRDLEEAIEAVAERSAQAADRAGTDPSASSAELRGLVEDARRALSRARKLVTGYHDPSVGSELATTRSLFDAAGIAFEANVRDRQVLAMSDLEALAALRAAVGEVLADDAVGNCWIELAMAPNGKLLLQVRSAPVASPRTRS
jgi:hypothetical protein